MIENSYHILLADDDEDDRLFFRDAFKELKLKTVLKMVNDGVELMEYLKTPNVQLPNVIFLDINMPRKGGKECLREIRQDERLKNLSVAIYSTSSSEDDIEETLVLGANIYIKKPNDFASLKKVLSDVITLNWQYHTSGLNKDNFWNMMFWLGMSGGVAIAQYFSDDALVAGVLFWAAILSVPHYYKIYTKREV